MKDPVSSQDKHSPAAGRPRRFLFACLTVVLASALTLVLVELAVRTYRRTANAILPAHRQISAKRTQAAKWIYYTPPWFFPFRVRGTGLWSLVKPFSEDFRFDTRHNSFGFRTPEYTVARAGGTFRILTIGDSLTWGQGVRMEETYPRVLEASLKQGGLKNGASPEVIALGVCGHRIVDNFMKLVFHGKFLKPDMVVLQLCANDLDYFSTDAIANSWAAVSPTFWQKMANAFSFLRELDVRRELTAARRRECSRTSMEWRIFIETLEELAKWNQQSRVPIVVLAFPLLDPRRSGGNFNDYTKRFEMMDLYGEVVAEIGKHGFPTLYLLDEFRRKAGGRYLAVSPADGHPNALAHQLAADALAIFLYERGLLPAKSTPLNTEDPLFQAEAEIRRDAEKGWFEYNQSYGLQEEFFRRSLQIRPGDPWTTAALADVCRESGKSEEAFRLYQSLEALAPGVAAPWHSMSRLSKDPAERRRLLEKTLETVPDHSDAMEDLAALDFAENRIEEGCHLLARAAEKATYKERLQRALEELSKYRCTVKPSQWNVEP